MARAVDAQRTAAVIIINPISGGHQSAREIAERVALARRFAGERAAVHVTSGPDHATALARAAVEQGTGLVIAWGGDGTINEVGLALAFGPAALGIVPAGSGDGLARELRIPASPARALEVALHGREQRIDAGELGGRLFFNVAGVGADAWIAHRFNTGAPGERRGLLRYMALVARAAREYAPPAVAVTADGTPVEASRPYLLTIANSRQFGNRARVAPDACLDDGQLDLVMVQGRSAGQAFWRMRGLLGRGLKQGPGLTFTTAAEIRIDSDAPIDFHVDGEPVRGGPSLVARVRPGALKVRRRAG